MFSKNKIQKIAFFCLLSFVVRLFFSQLPSFEIDMNAWLAWAWRLKELGASQFYTDDVWTQYTPGFLYWLWLGGILGLVNEFWIKIPVILADIAVGVIIWSIVRKKSERFANISFFLYTVSPVTIFTGSIWGQIDGILTLFLVISSYFLIEKKNFGLSGFFWALAFLVKPQAIVFLPVVIFLAFINRSKVKDYIFFIATSAATLLTLSLPFFLNNPIFGLPQLVEKMTGYYNYTSVFAFNIWSVIVGMWKADNSLFLGISYQFWGAILYFLAIFAIFWRFRKGFKNKKTQYLIIALSLFASFLFPTRVHERYLFPVFAFLLISAGLSKSKFLFGSYIFLSVLNFLNLYHPYAYYSENLLRSESLLALTGSLARPIGFLSVFIFFGIIKFANDGNLGGKTQKYIKETFPSVHIKKQYLKLLLIGILAFAFLSRVFELGSPKKEYFDEVYHAFTARQMLHGNPRAWDWFGTPPEGFAYEWTHPPVAKLGMIVGMILFGENSFGWRFPGAVLGTVSVYLVYLIAKKIFNDQLVGILAGGIFALDGLALVLSRIGMNDIYMLTFVLASLYFFLKNKNLLSAIFLGLALASKWSSLWAIPIIFLAHFVFKKKLSRSYLFFLILPPLIYLVSYLPFFIQGHSFKQFFNINVVTKCFGQTPSLLCDKSFGLQQQMWWYHTNLNATHPYTSAWWSWPINARPVYLYTSDTVNESVARIYLIGNPAVSWLGFLAILGLTFLAYKKRSRVLAFVVFSYLVFFVPWALSPRIMFLYHYFPSIPFLAIALAYFLRKYPKLIPVFLCTSVLVYLYFYPHWTGLWIPEWLDTSYYWFSSWR